MKRIFIRFKEEDHGLLIGPCCALILLMVVQLQKI